MYGWSNNFFPSGQNGSNFADDMFKRIFLNEKNWISNKMSFKYISCGLVDNMLAVVQIMAWHRPGDKPLPEPMLVSLLRTSKVVRAKAFINCMFSTASTDWCFRYYSTWYPEWHPQRLQLPQRCKPITIKDTPTHTHTQPLTPPHPLTRTRSIKTSVSAANSAAKSFWFFCTNHNSVNAMLYAKYKNDWAMEKCVMGK